MPLLAILLSSTSLGKQSWASSSLQRNSYIATRSSEEWLRPTHLHGQLLKAHKSHTRPSVWYSHMKYISSLDLFIFIYRIYHLQCLLQGCFPGCPHSHNLTFSVGVGQRPTASKETQSPSMGNTEICAANGSSFWSSSAGSPGQLALPGVYAISFTPPALTPKICFLEQACSSSSSVRKW